MAISIKKVFWKSVTVQKDGFDYVIYLDNHLLKTPKKSLIKLPNQKLADLVAKEWVEQINEIDYNIMPVNRLANAAIDKVGNNVDEVITLLGEYAGTDLLCYRVEEPNELIDQQILYWDPYIKWAEEKFGIKLNVTNGIVPIEQPVETMHLLISKMKNMSVLKLTVFHELVTISGSYILGLAAVEKAMPSENIWNAAILDENWQSSAWGEDQEQKKNLELKKVGFFKAIEVLGALA
tara:strand:+ start:313 stop:1020 length:708 start_codon:yes stop_codon:yes gene_type:complete